MPNSGGCYLLVVLEHSSANLSRHRLIKGFDHILHGGDYCPEQWLADPQVLEADRRLRRLSGCNTFTVGIFSWSHLEPSEGVFEFDWLDRVMDELAEDGCKAILATPSAARPAWMAKKYPEVMRTGRDFLREKYNARHNFCWSSPLFRQKVREINSLLASRYKNHPALGMWHISNELGGKHGNGECFCELCLARWCRWLEQKYKTIDTLNDAWWSGFWSHRYTCWEEINPADPTLEACSLDWSRFVNYLMKDWVEFEAATVREHTPEIPVTTNFMGVNPWIDYAFLAEAVDVVCDDQYPALHVSKPDLEGDFLATAFKHDLQRNYKPGRPFFLMESCPETPQWKKPQALKDEFLHRAEMLQAVGHGAEGTCYFQWRKGRGGLERLHGAVVDHEGTEHTRTFGVVSRLSHTYNKLRPVLGSRRTAQVALLYDHDSRRVHELGTGLMGGGFTYLLVAQEHYHYFWRRGIAVDVLDSRRRWEEHRIVIAPMLYLLHPGVAGRIHSYVCSGGTFVATTLTGCVDESVRCLLGGWPGEGLREVFGLWDEEQDHLAEGEIFPVLECATGQHIGAAGTVVSVVHAHTAQVLARFGPSDRIPCGKPAILENHFSKGSAYYHAGRLDRAALTAFYNEILPRLGIAGPFKHAPAAGVVFSSRSAETGRQFWFFSNTSNRACRIEPNSQIHAELLCGDGLHDGAFHLPPRSDSVWMVEPRH